VSWNQVFRALWARRLIVVLATLGCLAGAAVPVMLLPWRYQATSKLLIDLSSPDPVSGTSIPGKALSAYVNTQLRIIGDYRVTGAVVDALGWTSAPSLIDQYNRRPPGDTRDFRRYLADLVAPGIGARLLADSNIIEISYTAASPEAARVIADALRTAYVEQVLVQQREASLKTALFYDEQAARWLKRLQQSTEASTAYSRAKGTVLVDDTRDLAGLELRDATRAVPTISTKARAQERVRGAGAEVALAQVDARIATLASLLGPNHPQLVQLRSQRTALAAAAAAVRQQSGGSPAAAVTDSASLTGDVGRVLANREKVGQLRVLNSEAAILRDRFSVARARAVEFHRNAEATTTTLTELGRTVAKPRPIFPNLPFVFGGALALGLVLGGLVALLTELLGARVRGPEEIETARWPVFILPR